MTKPIQNEVPGEGGVFFERERTSFGFLFASLHCMTKPIQNEVPGEGGVFFKRERTSFGFLFASLHDKARTK